MTLSYGIAVPLLAEADHEARRLGHSYVAPEHLLIALADNVAGRTREFLDGAGLRAQTMRDVVDELVGPMRRAASSDTPLALALRTQLALADAIRLGNRHRELDAPFAPDDLLVALLGDDVAETGVVGGILTRCGLTPALARERFATFTGHAA